MRKNSGWVTAEGELASERERGPALTPIAQNLVLIAWVCQGKSFGIAGRCHL